MTGVLKVLTVQWSLSKFLSLHTVD